MESIYFRKTEMSRQVSEQKHKLEGRIGKKYFKRSGMKIMERWLYFIVEIHSLQKLSEVNVKTMDLISEKKCFKFYKYQNHLQNWYLCANISWFCQVVLIPNTFLLLCLNGWSSVEIVSTKRTMIFFQPSQRKINYYISNWCWLHLFLRPNYHNVTASYNIRLTNNCYVCDMVLFTRTMTMQIFCMSCSKGQDKDLV